MLSCRVSAVRFRRITRSTLLAVPDVAFGTQPVPFEKIPGPRRIPFLGMINDVVHLGKPAELHLRISQYHDRYGDLVRLLIGTQNAVFVRDPDLMRKAFQQEGQYPRHPLPESWTYFNRKHNYQRGLFFMDGKEWLQSRQIFNKPMLKEYTWMEDPIRRICEAKMTQIRERSADGTPFRDIESFMHCWSVEVVLAVMLGEAFFRCQESPEFLDLVRQFSRVVYDIFHYSAELMNIPPAIADRMNVHAWVQFQKLVIETIRLATAVIEYGMQHTEQRDGLLELMTQKLDKPLMMRIFVDFIIAAGDTTAFSTVWALYLLARNRVVQQTVRADVLATDGMECAAVKGVVRETLRLYPVAPFIGRFVDNDCTFREYMMPKDTLVLLSLFSAGRDERFFSDPLQFNPYRWQRNNPGKDTATNTPLASMPFAIGARSCIGQKIALLQMHYLLSMMLTEFEITMAGESERPGQDEPIKPILKMITVPNNPLNVCFQPLN